MEFRKKYNEILDETIDILVLKEYESLEKLNMDKFNIKPSSSFWFGTNQNKGVAVLRFGDVEIRQVEVLVDNSING